MRRKIKIKVKHLIGILFAVFLSVFFLVPNALFIYAKAMEESNIEESKVFYKRYISLFPFANKKAEALYNLAQKIVPADCFNNRYKIYATGFGGGGTFVTNEMVSNAVIYYREILNQHKGSEYYIKAYSSLLNLYYMVGMFDESEKLIMEGLNSEREDLRLTASKYKMLGMIIGRNYMDGRNLGESLIENGKGDPDIYVLMGDINLYERRLDDALRFYNEANGMIRWTPSGAGQRFILGYSENIVPDSRIRMVEKIKSGYTGTGSIHGKVEINGRPVPFAYVYLKDEKDGDMNSIGDEESRISTITDYKGEYVIPNLPEGNYLLGVGITPAYLDNTLFKTPKEGFFHLNKGESKEYSFTFVPPMKLVKPTGAVVPESGKVDIEWEKVEGASYYIVRLVVFGDPTKENGGGSYAGVSASDKLTGTKYTIDINKLNMRTLGFMMNDEGILNPQAYLGIFYPCSRVPFSVEAFDKDGSLIKSSVPMKMNFKDMAVIYMPQGGLTEGDALILQSRPGEAAKIYEEYLKKNPNDINAMMVLSKIYSIGTKRKFVPGKGEEIEGRNKERAIELTRKLYEITGDSYYFRASLSNYFIDGVKDYKWALDEYSKISEKELDAEDFARIASMNLTLKNYKEADRYYEKIYEIYKDTNYFDLTPVILRLYLGDFENSLKFLDILDLKLYKVDKSRLIYYIKRLSELDRESSDYKKFKEAIGVLMNYRSDREYRKQYIEVYESIKSPVLSEILKSAGSYYMVFDRYPEDE